MGIFLMFCSAMGNPLLISVFGAHNFASGEKKSNNYLVWPENNSHEF